MASLMWTGKHCILSEVTICLNRGLCGTFLTEKLLNLAILTLFQSNIFLAILGYREISQYHRWYMSRSCALRQFPWESFLTGLKGIETNVVHSVFRNMAGKKNKGSPDPKSIGNSSGDQNQIFMLKYLDRFGCLSGLGYISLLKAQPTLSQMQGRKSEQNHISYPTVFCSCSTTLFLELESQHLSSGSTTFWVIADTALNIIIK